MEIDNNITTLQCFKIPHKILGNLKISCDIKNSKVVLWSKYQIYIYENLNFTNYTSLIEPQFEIENVIVYNGYLVCLDCSGNVNVNTEDFFFIWKQNIKCICICDIMNTQYVIGLQFEHNRAVLLIDHFDINDSPDESVELELPNEEWLMPGEKTIMVCGHITLEYWDKMKTKFNIGKFASNCLLVVISFDKKNVYAILFPFENEHNKIVTKSASIWIKLHKTHAEIVDIKITMMNEIYILLGLTGGNLIRIPLILMNHKPEVYHLNSTINKFTIMDNTIIFTDGLTMWKTKNVFAKSEAIEENRTDRIEQFIVKNVRDFTLVYNNVICITYSNLIYYFNIDHRSCYKKPLDADDTCAVQLVTNSEYLHKIMETVQKNEELLQKINRESRYMMALSLSKRQDLMDEVIKVTAGVYNNYCDVALNHTDLTLTDEFNTYYDSKSYYFLITFSVARIQHKLNKLLSDVLGDIKIHITLFNPKVLKTTSIQIEGQLTTKKFVIPLKRKNRNIRRMQICVKIITKIPGKYDEKQSLWTILYQKYIDLKAENFIDIKPNMNNITLLKRDESLEILIYKRAKFVYGSLCKFHMLNDKQYVWTFFVKLPPSILCMEDILKMINPAIFSKAYVSLKNLIEYSKSKSWLEFEVAKNQVRLDIEGPSLKVACQDIMIALDIRNFFANVIFTSNYDEPAAEFIDQKYYSTIENLKRGIDSCLTQQKSTQEFVTLLTRFLRTVYCLIPI